MECSDQIEIENGIFDYRYLDEFKCFNITIACSLITLESIHSKASLLVGEVDPQGDVEADGEADEADEGEDADPAGDASASGAAEGKDSCLLGLLDSLSLVCRFCLISFRLECSCSCLSIFLEFSSFGSLCSGCIKLRLSYVHCGKRTLNGSSRFLGESLD